MSSFEERVREVGEWVRSPRFDGIVRLYAPHQVVEQRGTIAADYSVARKAAEGFYTLLRELFQAGKSITTFGPYSPGQAVTLKRLGIDVVPRQKVTTSTRFANSDVQPCAVLPHR